MSATPGLVFRKVQDEEAPLVAGVMTLIAGLDDPKCEAWGVNPGGPPPDAGEQWGLYMNGSLVGLAWLKPAAEPGMTEVSALALPRRRWGMGIVVWLLSEVARQAEAGTKGIIVNITYGGVPLGMALEDSGFAGPPPEDPEYPMGQWRLVLGS